MKRLVCALGAVALVLVLSACGSGVKHADEPIKPRKRDPRATPDDPNAEAVKPPAPPEESVDPSGLTPVERDAIAAMKKHEGGAQPVPALPKAGTGAGAGAGAPAVDEPARGRPAVAGPFTGGLGPWIQPAGPIPTVPVRAKKPEPEMTLLAARKEMKSHITKQVKSGEAVEVPPAGVFDLVKYKSPVGELAAYVSPDPKDGTKRPAIVWITGGDCNTIGNVWDEIDPKNEQQAVAYRNAGIVMMFPSLRGGNRNPGVKEGFLGEVDDVIAAGEYVAKLKYVDPTHVYLGGHSSGGTMALLTAESTTRFRAAFCFGPVGDIQGYLPGDEQMVLPFDQTRREELAIRSPGVFLDSIERPTFIIEGTKGNYQQLRTMAKVNQNPYVTILSVAGADHFEVLHPINSLIAKKILSDKTPESNITITDGELKRAMGK